MLVKLRTLAAGPDGVWLANRIYDFPDKMAADLLASGSADKVEAIESPVESATVEPEERAIAPNQKRRGGKNVIR